VSNEQLPAPLAIVQQREKTRAVKDVDAKSSGEHKTKIGHKHQHHEAIALAGPRSSLEDQQQRWEDPKEVVAGGLRNREEGTYRTAFSRKASDWRDAGPQKVPRRTTTSLGRYADRFEGTKRV
jgi:hypothetical protein